MNFPSEQKTYMEIWSSDFNTYIQNYFGVDYHYADALDYPSQNTYYTFSVGMGEYDGSYVWNEADESVPFDCVRFLEDMRDGVPLYEKPSVESVLEYLWCIDEIPAGEYLFFVWW